MPLICNRCGKKVGDHLKASVMAACAASGQKPSTVQLRATANKAISRLKTHTPFRKHNPSRPHNPRVTH